MLPDSFSAVAGTHVTWNIEAGIGYAQPVGERLRDHRAIDAEQAHDLAIAEEKFAEIRRELVERTAPGIDWSNVVDVTFGERAFANMTGCKVFDLDHARAAALRARGAYFDLTARSIDFACFWDCLDRFIEPSELLRHVRRIAFISLPLHHTIDAVADSPYFQPGRRMHYWTHAGFARYTEALGFEAIGGAFVVANHRPKGIVGIALRRTVKAL